jgi:fluoride exporter
MAAAWLTVFTGGLVGSAMRSGISLALPTPAGTFPTATLAVNLVGSLLIGLFLARWERSAARNRSLRFWAIGALGSFTTFSAFSLETVQLMDAHEPVMAVGYLVGSVAGGLILAVVGLRLGSVQR